MEGVVKGVMDGDSDMEGVVKGVMDGDSGWTAQVVVGVRTWRR
jgi:hypothetical protein